MAVKSCDRAFSQVQSDENCCSSPSLTNSNGYCVCANCGIVKYDYVYDHKEPRAYGEDEKKEKIKNEAFHSIGHRTEFRINHAFLEMNGSRSDKMKYQKLLRYQKQRDSLESNFIVGHVMFQVLKNYVDFTKYIQDEAERLYRIVAKKGICRGKKISEITAACVYIFIRKETGSISIKEYAKCVEMSTKTLFRSIRAIMEMENINMPHTSAKGYIERVGNKNEFDRKIIERAKKIADLLKMNQAQNRNGIAAAAVYLAAKSLKIRYLTQKKLAELFSTTEVTLRARMIELKEIIAKKKVINNGKAY